MATVGAPIQPFPLVQGTPLPNETLPNAVPPPGMGSQISDFPVPPPPLTPTPADPNMFERMKQTPEGQMALLQFFGGLLQPVGAGQSAAGIMGKSLSDAAGAFTQSNAARDDRGVKRETLAQAKELDEGVNPVEQSLIDYRNSLGSAAKKTAAARGMTESAYKNAVREETLASIQNNYKLTRSQAVTALAAGEAVDFVNFPDIAKAVMVSKVGENASFDPVDVEAFIPDTGGVPSGTGTPEFDTAATTEFNSWPDEDVIAASNQPQVEKRIVERIGQGAFDSRLRQATRNSK